jgi:hypothetical protein
MRPRTTGRLLQRSTFHPNPLAISVKLPLVLSWFWDALSLLAVVKTMKIAASKIPLAI